MSFDRECVLLALDDIDTFATTRGSKYVREPEEHTFNTLQVPDPPAIAIGSALAEALGLEANDLTEEGSVRVGVVVGGGDSRRRCD
jgi:hypothetical protein